MLLFQGFLAKIRCAFYNKYGSTSVMSRTTAVVKLTTSILIPFAEGLPQYSRSSQAFIKNLLRLNQRIGDNNKKRPVTARKTGLL